MTTDAGLMGVQDATVRTWNAADVSGPGVESSASGVSWGAILAGAAAASVVTLILGFVGAGLGLAVSMPWNGQGTSGAAASTMAMGAAVWLVVMQWVSSGVGGYLAGRLRAKWSTVLADEVFFRDTAHGFLAWSVATLLTAMVVASSASSVADRAATTAASAIGGAAQSATTAASSALAGQSDYFVDMLMRPAPAAPGGAPAAGGAQAGADPRAETGRLIARAATGTLSQPDRDYLAQMVASRAGLPQDEARKRVDDVIAQVDNAKTQAAQAAETARKAGATTALLTALSLLIGAFVASAAAALGGRQRDL